MTKPTVPDWTGAACVDTDPDVFFPGRGSTYAEIRKAKVICYACPIRQRCLDYAMEAHQVHGIWGGTSEAERRRMRRQQAHNPGLRVVPS